MAPEQKDEIAKTLMDDMKNEPTSFKEALEKARQPQGDREQGSGIREQQRPTVAEPSKPVQPLVVKPILPTNQPINPPSQDGQNPL